MAYTLPQKKGNFRKVVFLMGKSVSKYLLATKEGKVLMSNIQLY